MIPRNADGVQNISLDDAFHLSTEHQPDSERESLYKASGSLTPPGEKIAAEKIM